MATEKWDKPLDYEKLLNILPIPKITEILGKDPRITILLDEDIKKIKPYNYNMSIMNRAYNDNMESRLKKYWEYHENEVYADLMKINLPQIFFKDNLNLKHTIIGLHVSKLRKDELFINDVVLAKNEELDGLKNGIFDVVLDNLTKFAKEQNLKYISGHAVNQTVYKIFLQKGYKADVRTHLRNDKLYKQSTLTNAQIPFYKEI